MSKLKSSGLPSKYEAIDIPGKLPGLPFHVSIYTLPVSATPLWANQQLVVRLAFGVLLLVHLFSTSLGYVCLAGHHHQIAYH